MESGIYARTDIIKALDDNDGDVTEAIQQLQRMTFEPMLQRIKDSCIPDDDAVDNRQYMARQTSTTQDDEIFEAIVSNKDIDMDVSYLYIYIFSNFPFFQKAGEETIGHKIPYNSLHPTKPRKNPNQPLYTH